VSPGQGCFRREIYDWTVHVGCSERELREALVTLYQIKRLNIKIRKRSEAAMAG
jgi:hypothetical protein